MPRRPSRGPSSAAAGHRRGDRARSTRSRSASPRDVPFTVDADGDVVLVHFGGALDYDTNYRVTLAGVVAAAGGAAADITYDLTHAGIPGRRCWCAPTGAIASCRSLRRRARRCCTREIASRTSSRFPARCSSSASTSTGTAFASIVATDGSGNAEYARPARRGAGAHRELARSPARACCTRSPRSIRRAPPRRLPVFDQTCSGSTSRARTISDRAGADGAPLAVDTVIPVPGSAEVLLHSRAGERAPVRPGSGDAPTLLAAYPEMVALVGGRARALGERRVRPADLRPRRRLREARRAVAARTDTGAVPFIADVIPLSGDRLDRARRGARTRTSPRSTASSRSTTGPSRSTLYRPGGRGGSILDFRLTANERYLVAEVSPGGDSLEASDGYETDARPRDVTTSSSIVVDRRRGRAVAGVARPLVTQCALVDLPHAQAGGLQSAQQLAPGDRLGALRDERRRGGASGSRSGRCRTRAPGCRPSRRTHAARRARCR